MLFLEKGMSEKPGKLEVGGASRDSTGLGALEEGLISSRGRNRRVPLISDSDRRVPADWGQESQASSWVEAWNSARSEEHTSDLQSPKDLVCRLLLEKKNPKQQTPNQQT